MNKLQCNDLNMIVYIQYAVGFDMIEGEIEIETTIFNKTQKSRPVAANRSRLNFDEEFIWKVDKNRLKHCRTTNEMVKIECFTTLSIIYGNVYRRKRIGHVIIKLKEFQIIGRDWDQSISVRGFKLQGTSGYYELRVILVIQDDTDLNSCEKFKKQIEINKKQKEIINENQVLEPEKQDLTKNKSKPRSSTNKDNLQKEPNKVHDKYRSQSKNILDEQELQYQETSNKCQHLLNTLQLKDSKNKLSWKNGMQNELNSTKKKIEQSIKESRESLEVNEYNEFKFSELLSNCLKYTEKTLKIMKQIKKDLDTDNLKKNSSNSISNSSIEFENDLEIPLTLEREIKKKLNELIQYTNARNEIIRNNKTKRNQEISNLKNINCHFSQLCDFITKKIIEDDNTSE